ncbi:hypothetical protein HMPREF1986_01529 [Oribacterium sp. oral taxon 078 str. F0263]|nr:hypothetical protein HMPREF1986_01529 [Oribacterium sp. oral taxon 078 str. F0263]
MSLPKMPGLEDRNLANGGMRFALKVFMIGRMSCLLRGSYPGEGMI